MKAVKATTRRWLKSSALLHWNYSLRLDCFAVKDGSRVLLVRTEHHASNKIVVAVEDSGPGIDPKKLGGIFDAFVSTKPQGMGLGLAICRMIIERHGGQFSAWSGKKRGAVFQFILPATKA
jgi:signal transduction histidine kinase